MFLRPGIAKFLTGATGLATAPAATRANVGAEAQRWELPGNWIWALLPAVLAFVHIATNTQYPQDYWHQVTTGEAIWQSGSLVRLEPFAFTIAGQPIINHNWLAQLLFYGVHQCGGYAAAQMMTALLYVAAVMLLQQILWWRAHEMRTVALLALVALGLSLANVTVRPQVFSVLLFVAELYVLWFWPPRWWRIAAVVAIEVLWTNMHGAFPLGVVLPGLFFASQACQAVVRSKTLAAEIPWKRLAHELACTLAAAGAMFVNPFPASTWMYFAGVVNRAPARGIEEWLPTSWGSFTGQTFMISLAVTVCWLARNTRRLTIRETLLLGAFCILAAHSIRMVVWWGIVLAVVASRDIGSAARRSFGAGQQDRSLANTLAVAALLILAAFSTPWTRCYNVLLPTAKRSATVLAGPTHAAMDMRADPPQRVFAPMLWGAELAWRLSPQTQVFLDCRLDFYPDHVWSDYLSIGLAGPHWREKLNHWGVDAVVWNKQLSPALPTVLAADDEWKKTYEDSAAVVYRRRKRPGTQ